MAETKLTDGQLDAANLAYTKALFPECSETALRAEWERWGEKHRANARKAMDAAIRAALTQPETPDHG